MSFTAVGYAFNLPAADLYKSVTFRVLGKSTNNRQAYEEIVLRGPLGP